MNKREYRPEIDGLRAIAVLAVVGYHYSLIDSVFQNGFIGVDIFFVISGYLITQILASSVEERGWIKNFYFRRIRRIFPVLLVVLTATLLAGLLILLPFELKDLGKQIFFSGFFSGNFYFWSETGYFDTESIRKPLLHLWSLGVEEQFYIFFPFLVYASVKLRIKTLFVCLFVVFTSILYLLLFAKNDPSMSYFSPLTRMWELGVGGVTASLQLGGQIRFRQVYRVVGLFLLILGFSFSEVGSAWPNLTTAFSVLGTAMLLLFVHQEGFISLILRSRLIVLLGKMSYSLYLWHWPIISLYVIAIGYPPTRQGKYALLFIAFSLSYITLKFVELPSRKVQLTSRNIGYISAALLVISILGLGIAQSGGLQWRASTSVSGAAVNTDVLEQFEAIEFSNSECLNDYPNPSTSSYLWWFCRTNKSVPPNLLLWGNSFANQYFHGFSSNSYLGQRSIISIGDCPIEREIYLVPPNPCAGSNFDDQRNFVKSIVSGRTTSDAIVVLAGLSERPDESSLSDLNDALTFLQLHQKQVVIFYPHIKPKRSILGCIDRPIKNATWDCKLSRQDYENLLQDFGPTVSMIERSFSSVKIFNPNDAFCNQEGCSFMISGVPIIRDDAGHMSGWGSELVAKSFERWLRNN